MMSCFKIKAGWLVPMMVLPLLFTSCSKVSKESAITKLKEINDYLENSDVLDDFVIKHSGTGEYTINYKKDQYFSQPVIYYLWEEDEHYYCYSQDPKNDWKKEIDKSDFDTRMERNRDAWMSTLNPTAFIISALNNELINFDINSTSITEYKLENKLVYTIEMTNLSANAAKEKREYVFKNKKIVKCTLDITYVISSYSGFTHKQHTKYSFSYGNSKLELPEGI